MPAHALIDNVRISADQDSGVPSIAADVYFVGNSVSAARNMVSVSVPLVANDSTASINGKMLAAVDAQAAGFGYPNPTNVLLGPSLTKLR